MKALKEIIEENKEADKVAGRTKIDVVDILDAIIFNIKHHSYNELDIIEDLDIIKAWVQKQ